MLPVGLLEALVERPDLVLGDPPRPLPPHAGNTKDLGLPEAGGEQDREAGDDLPVIGADQLVRARSRQPEPDVDPVEQFERDAELTAEIGVGPLDAKCGTRHLVEERQGQGTPLDRGGDAGGRDTGIGEMLDQLHP